MPNPIFLCYNKIIMESAPRQEQPQNNDFTSFISSPEPTMTQFDQVIKSEEPEKTEEPESQKNPEKQLRRAFYARVGAIALAAAIASASAVGGNPFKTFLVKAETQDDNKNPDEETSEADETIVFVDDSSSDSSESSRQSDLPETESSEQTEHSEQPESSEPKIEIKTESVEPTEKTESTEPVENIVTPVLPTPENGGTTIVVPVGATPTTNPFETVAKPKTETKKSDTDKNTTPTSTTPTSSISTTTSSTTTPETATTIATPDVASLAAANQAALANATAAMAAATANQTAITNAATMTATANQTATATASGAVVQTPNASIGVASSPIADGLDVAMRTAFAEGAYTSEDAARKVADVIINRAVNNGTSVGAEVAAKGQFEAYINGSKGKGNWGWREYGSGPQKGSIGTERVQQIFMEELNKATSGQPLAYNYTGFGASGDGRTNVYH